MSPELNGNPPVLIKRKKKRDKKHSSASKINDNNPPSYNFFQGNNLHSYPNIAMNDSYFGFPNYSLPTEPVSLPIYHPPTYPNLHMLNLNHSHVFNTNSKNFLPNDGTEYMSLPVVNGESVEENSEQRRYSDPGLPNDSDSSTNSHESHLIHSLTQQLNVLRENNRKLNREVHELRVELNVLKQQQVVRHSEREYEPGMITDMIREIRDAARVREDALLAKVKHMVEEKQFSLSQLHLTSEKNRNNERERLSKIEDMIKSLNLNSSRSEDNISLPSTSATFENSASARQVLELENENLNLRRELQDVKARKDESDQKVLQLTNLLRPQKTESDTSEDGKHLGSSMDTLSITTHSSVISNSPHRVTLSGPVTDL